MSGRDLAKEDLYSAVKTVVESEHQHIHFTQQKLFTLFSIAFQYMLYRSTKKAGAYIIRIEDSQLVDKLARKSKDSSTRRFIQSLLLPRKLKYGKSTFYLDFFHLGSWSLTTDIPREKIQGAIVVKGTQSKPMTEVMDENEEGEQEPNPLAALPKDYFISTLAEFVPKTITIAYEWESETCELQPMTFPFIKKEKDFVAGLKVSNEIDLDHID